MLGLRLRAQVSYLTSFALRCVVFHLSLVSVTVVLTLCRNHIQFYHMHLNKFVYSKEVLQQLIA